MNKQNEKKPDYSFNMNLLKDGFSKSQKQPPEVFCKKMCS